MEKEVIFYNGLKMPIVGLGTLMASDEEIAVAVDAALEVGYRHIDTAYYYKNEGAIGKALKKWLDAGKVKREELFIVTKLPVNRAGSVEKYMKRSLEALQLDYVDLYLIHHPCGLERLGGVGDETDTDTTTDHVSLWKAMEAQVDAGRARSIGVSNFNSSQIARIVKAARIHPANVQMELHVFFQQRELVAFLRALDVTVCAYAPMGSPAIKAMLSKNGVNVGVPGRAVLTDPVVVRIAKAHGRNPAHVLLRHIIQRGIAVIPKSTNPGRIKDNFQVFDFELTKDEVEELDALDLGPEGRMYKATTMQLSERHPDCPFNERY